MREAIMNPEELYLIGNKYYFGNQDRIGTNKQTAIKYFIQSAEAGYVPAQLMVGYMYDFADGVAANPKKAIFWYKKASDAGEGNATLNLANMYSDGRGVRKNIAKADRLYRKAVSQNNAVAASILGNHYLMGIGVPVSLSEGANYIRLAEQWGYINSDHINNLGCSYKSVKNYNEAFKCFKKALQVDKTNDSAIWNYGFSLYNGQGTDIDYKAAEPYIADFLKRNPNDEQAELVLKGIEMYYRLEHCLDILIQLFKGPCIAIYEVYYGISVINESLVSVYCHFERCDNHRQDDKRYAYDQNENWDEFERLFSVDKIETRNSGMEDCTYLGRLPVVALTKKDVFSVIIKSFNKYPDISVRIDYGDCRIFYSEH